MMGNIEAGEVGLFYLPMRLILPKNQPRGGSMPELTVQAPEGAHWAFEEVKTKGGSETLGEHPILVWDSVDGMLEHYGEEGTLNMANGTSLKVSMQAIARRSAIAKKSDDEIAEAQVKFQPGKRAVGQSTPQSRAKRAAAKAAEAVGAEKADNVAAFLARVAAGDPEALAAIGG